MDCRDGFVNFPVSLPVELRYLVERYQSHMKVRSLNGTIRMLLETHPALDKELQMLYAEVVTSPMGE